MTKEEFRSKTFNDDMYFLLDRMDTPALRARVLKNAMTAQKIIGHMDDERSIAGVNAAIAFGESRISIHELWLAYEDAARAVMDKRSSKAYAVAYAASMAAYVSGEEKYCDGSYCKW